GVTLSGNDRGNIEYVRQLSQTVNVGTNGISLLGTFTASGFAGTNGMAVIGPDGSVTSTNFTGNGSGLTNNTAMASLGPNSMPGSNTVAQMIATLSTGTGVTQAGLNSSNYLSFNLANGTNLPITAIAGGMPSGAAAGMVLTLTNATTGQGTWSNAPAGGGGGGGVTAQDSNILSAAVTNNGPATLGAVTAASFSGNGNAVSNINGGQLVGTVLNTTNGNVGIGTTNPVAKLDVNGNVNVTGNTTNSGTVTASGFATTSGTFSGSGSGLTNIVASSLNTVGTVTNALPSVGWTNNLGYDVRLIDLTGTGLVLTNVITGHNVAIGTIVVNNNFLILHTNDAILGSSISGVIWQ
ncbi:MAG: hypothetical protein ACLPYZ_10250, partial [Limisphaerales bacterium]